MENKTFDVNRRTVVRTAAWTAPAVAVAAGAPAFAATPTAPNLSTSTISAAPTRGTDGTVAVAPGTITFVNSGTTVEGLNVSIALGGSGGASASGVPTQAPLGSITAVLLAGQPLEASGLGTSNVSFSIPKEIVTIPKDGSYPLSLPLEFVSNEHRATTATVTVTAANGGEGTAFAPISFPALNVANLSQSASTGAPTRPSATTMEVPPTKFVNAGSVATTGARVTIVSSKAITKMQAKSFITLDLTATGVTFESGYAPGAGQTTIIFRTGASGQLSNMAVPAGGEKTSSAPQLWTFDSSGPVTFSTKVEPIVGTVGTAAPEGIGVQFQTFTI